MKNIIIALILVSLSFEVVFAESKPRVTPLPSEPYKGEKIKLAWSKLWELGYQYEKKGEYTIEEYVPIGGSVEDWSELFTIVHFFKKSGAPRNLFNHLKAEGEKLCPGLRTWKVISKDRHSILYEWTSKPCAQWQYHQYTIVRILDGRETRFKISYAAKAQDIPEGKRSDWIHNLSKASIWK